MVDTQPFMKKSDKKLENNLRKALTIACEDIKDEVEDFCWLTHEVNYQQFPQSLSVVCYFTQFEAIEHVKTNSQDSLIREIIAKHLTNVGVTPFNVNKQIVYRSED